MMMTGMAGTSKTGRWHHYYRCSPVKTEKPCDKKRVKKEWIERLVVEPKARKHPRTVSTKAT